MKLDQVTNSHQLNSTAPPLPVTQFQDRFINEKEASEIFGYSVAWWQRGRWSGNTPPYYKIGRSVKYRVSEVLSYFEKHRRNSTSDIGPCP